MLNLGDELKIIEERPYNRAHKGRTTIGVIEFICSKTITVRRIFRGEKKGLTSFCIADFKDERIHFFRKDNEKWVPIKIKVTEPNMNEVMQGKGSKYD
jgi:hypothetical protein